MSDYGMARMSLEDHVRRDRDYGYSDRQSRPELHSDRSVRSTGGGFGQEQKNHSSFGEGGGLSRGSGTIDETRETNNQERGGAFGGGFRQRGAEKTFGARSDFGRDDSGFQRDGYNRGNFSNERQGSVFQRGGNNRGNSSNERENSVFQRGGFNRENSNNQREDSGFQRGGFNRGNFSNERDHSGFQGGGFNRGNFSNERQDSGFQRGGFNRRNLSNEREDSGFQRGGFNRGNLSNEREDSGFQRGGFNRGNSSNEREDSGFQRGGFNRPNFSNEREGGFHGRDKFEKTHGFNKSRSGGFGSSDWQSNGFKGNGNFERSLGNRGFNQQNPNYEGFGGDSMSFGRNGYRSDVSGERAPRDWMPNTENVDDLYRNDREQAEETNIEDDNDVMVDSPMRDIKLDSWENSYIGERLKDILVNKCGYRCPRKIQAAVIPQVCEGFDVIVHAETGSGKTASFVIPILNSILMKKKDGDQKKPHQPYALVLSPTRELTEQSFNQFQKFAKGTDIRVLRCYGQMDRFQLLKEIQQGVDVLCGCVGKIKDMVHRRDFNLEKVNFFVIDECDKMFGMNNKLELEELIRSQDFPKKGSYQTLMLTATLPESMLQQLKPFLRPDFVLCSNGAMVRANKRITQKFIAASGHREKNEALFNMLIREKEAMEKEGGRVRRTLVFVSQKKKTDMVAIDLTKKGILAASINGDRSQDQREKVMQQFRQGEIQVLVGTDVCERGLDIKDLEHVINFEMPRDRDTYVHRIGRTGRVKNGVATTFVDDRDENCIRFAKELVQIVSEVQQEVPDFLQQLADRGGSYGGGSSTFGRGSGQFHESSQNPGDTTSGIGGFSTDTEFKSGGFQKMGASSEAVVGGFGSSSSFPKAHSPASSGVMGPPTSVDKGLVTEMKDDANDDDW